MEREQFKLITLRPHWTTYLIKQGLTVLIGLAIILAAGHQTILYKMPVIMFGSFFFTMALWGCLSLYNLKFTISSELLIIEHGIFRRSSDYVELYRIVDFSEHRTMMEQLFGIKTVSIYSGDRTTPKLDIFGVKEKMELVSMIRERVEYNKQRKGVYEITNR